MAVEAFAGVSNVSVTAAISVGATVLDLGCGAGLDSLVASLRVGPGGQVVGIDFSEAMIARARRAAAEIGANNVDFQLADAERLPLGDASVDVALINGIFNQVALLFTLIHMQILAPALLFGSPGLTLMFSSLMVSTATIIIAGIPAAIYERIVSAKDDSTVGSLWIWLTGTALLTLPAIGNFFQYGL